MWCTNDMIPCTLPTHTHTKNKVSPISSYTCLLSLCMHRAYGGWWLVSGGWGTKGEEGSLRHMICVCVCGGGGSWDEDGLWGAAVSRWLFELVKGSDIDCPSGWPPAQRHNRGRGEGLPFYSPDLGEAMWEDLFKKYHAGSDLKKKQKNKTDCLVALQSITLTPN